MLDAQFSMLNERNNQYAISNGKIKNQKPKFKKKKMEDGLTQFKIKK